MDGATLVAFVYTIRPTMFNFSDLHVFDEESLKICRYINVWCLAVIANFLSGTVIIGFRAN